MSTAGIGRLTWVHTSKSNHQRAFNRRCALRLNANALLGCLPLFFLSDKRKQVSIDLILVCSRKTVGRGVILFAVSCAAFPVFCFCKTPARSMQLSQGLVVAGVRRRRT
jgi:hypothetical protein